MNIWVDADACPVVIKETLFRAADRTKTLTTLVANHTMRTPSSAYIKFQHVESGFDVADNKIVKQIQNGDLLITSDIPLAAEAVEKGATVLSPRGELYTEANIRARLNMRDLWKACETVVSKWVGQAPSARRIGKRLPISSIDG